MTITVSPLTQGRELKLFQNATISRTQGVAPHAGA